MMNWKTTIRQLTAGFLAVLTLAGSAAAWNEPASTNYPPLTDNGVKARFVVGSDLHIGRTDAAAKLTNAYSEFYAAADSKLDAIAFVGDITDNGSAAQYDTLMGIINGNTQSGTTSILCMGNHEYYNGLSNADAQALFKQKTGQDINKMVEIKGVYIITLAAPSASGDYTSCYDFLKASLAAANSADPTAPIFVLAHHGVPNTAYVTDEWNGTYGNCEALLKQYPQVIHISGHSHSTIEDARSISQDDGFTAIQDGTVSAYFENESGTVSPTTGDAITCPEDCEVASQALMVEVSNQNVVTIHRMNLTTGQYIYDDEPWVINTPSIVNHDAGSFTYTNQRTGQAPAFAPDAAVSAYNVTDKTMTVHFPAANPTYSSNVDMIHTYRVTLTNTATGSTTTRSVFSDYYEPTQKAQWSVKIIGLSPATTYSVAVQAVTSFNNASAPITMADTVTTNQASAPGKPEQILDIDYSCGGVADAKGHTLTKFGTGGLEDGQIPGSAKKAMRFNGDGGYGYALSDSDYDKIDSSFTIEAYFKMDAVTGIDQCVFSNQQGAGMGFEVEDGNLEFWCNLSVNGKKTNPKPSFSITANEWVHAVGTYDGTTLKLYKNGVQVFSEDFPGTLTKPEPNCYFVGADVGTGNIPQYEQQGYVNSAKLYSGARSAAEVLADYKGATMPTCPLGQAYTLSDNQKSALGLSVKTPGGNPVTVTGGAFTPVVPGIYTISYTQGGGTVTDMLKVNGVDTTENTTWAPVNQPSFSALNDGGVHIAVSSDTHVGRSDYAYGGLTKLQTALKAYSQLAPDLSAYVFAGDSADIGAPDQYQKLMSALSSDADAKAKMIIAMGNHEYYNGLSAADAQSRFLQMTDQSDLDQDNMVGGYHVITVSPREGGYDHSNYKDEEAWILQKLDAAVAEDPNKPIFLIMHQGFANTVQYTGDDSWDGQFSSDFYSKLQNYPQVVHFSGHTHIPLNDPRSIYQDGFTMVQTATLGNDFWMQGGEVATDGTTGGHPADGWDASQGLMLSVNPNTNVVTIYRLDLRTGKYIGTPWTLDIPAMVTDAKNGTDEAFLYTTAKRENNSVLPSLAEGAQITVSDIKTTSATINVPVNQITVTGSADPDDIVESYRVAVYDPNGEKVSETVYMAGYYLAKQDAVFSRTISGLQENTLYTIKVYPRNAYQKEGGYFSANFTTPLSNLEPETPPTADFLNVDISTGSAADASFQHSAMNVKGQPKISFDNTLGRTVAVLDGSSAYGYDMDASKYAKIAKAFSSEVMFRVDQKPASADKYIELYSSGQSTGQNFEYYGDGKLYYYLSLSGSWVSVSAPVDTGAWTHAVAAYDGSSLKLYINGKLADGISLSGTLSAPQGTPQRYYLGADMNATGEPECAMTGRVALGRTYTRAVTAGEALGLYLQEQPITITTTASLPSGTVGSSYTIPAASAIGADGQSKTVSMSVVGPDGKVVSLTGSAFTPSTAGTYIVTFTAGKSAVTRTLSVAAASTPGYPVPANPGTSGSVTNGNTTTPVAVSTLGETTTANSRISSSADNTGKVSGSVDSKTISELEKAAKAAEESGKKAVIQIKLESASSIASAELTMPKIAFSAIAGSTSADLTLDTGIGSLTFDASAVDAINSAAAGDVKISIAKADTSGLSDTARTQIGDRPVYNFTVTAGNSTISSFGGGTAAISLPYTLKAGEDPNAIVVYFISDSGALQTVRGCYNATTGKVGFTTNHFSTYAVGYNKITFSDIAGTDWYCTPVTFIAARGITTGTTANNFSPDMKLTRGQFLVMLMRAYGISSDATPTSNFVDAGNTYYTGYLAAAKRLGITAGIGNNMFGPENDITRQEMLTLLYNVLKQIGSLPTEMTGKELSDYSDVNDIASWARDAMTLLVKSGTVSGNGKTLNPKAGATRAEMAQVLYNLLSK